MKYGELQRGDKPNAHAEEVILILPLAEARLLVEMAEAAVASSPRKGTWKKIAKQLDSLPCFL